MGKNELTEQNYLEQRLHTDGEKHLWLPTTGLSPNTVLLCKEGLFRNGSSRVQDARAPSPQGGAVQQRWAGSPHPHRGPGAAVRAAPLVPQAPKVSLWPPFSTGPWLGLPSALVSRAELTSGGRVLSLPAAMAGTSSQHAGQGDPAPSQKGHSHCQASLPLGGMRGWWGGSMAGPGTSRSGQEPCPGRHPLGLHGVRGQQVVGRQAQDRADA